MLDSLFKKEQRDSSFMRALSTKSNEVNNYAAEGFAYNSLGISYRNASLYEKSIELHKASLALAIKAEDIELQVVSLNMIGVVYRRMDLVKPALDYHTQALDLANSISEKVYNLKPV